jgi:hypothetical protein
MAWACRINYTSFFPLSTATISFDILLYFQYVGTVSGPSAIGLPSGECRADMCFAFENNNIPSNH